MRQACALPMATGAALMPDAHVGYGLPIGGVLALEGAVVPYAVGVDIACRMKLSVFDMPAWSLTDRLKFDLFERALEKGTRFGVGSVHQKPQDHAVMEQNWSVTRVTRENKDKAWRQLGTSGSGNHFVEFGLFSLPAADAELGLGGRRVCGPAQPQRQSRHRGLGLFDLQRHRTRRLPKKYESLGRLAWLDLDSEAGQEYWAAMNLMGDYAAANHDVIHRLVSKLLGAKIIAGVENHHNFAWKEIHGGREVIVHRKGATPADRGQLGVIPGSMADPAFVVRGRGCGRKPELGFARSRPPNVAHRGQEAVHLAGGAKESGAARRQSPLGRRRRGAGRLQKHRRRDARAARPGRSGRSLRSQDRQNVRRRQHGRGLTQPTARSSLAASFSAAVRTSAGRSVRRLSEDGGATILPRRSRTSQAPGPRPRLKAYTPAVSFVNASCSKAWRIGCLDHGRHDPLPPIGPAQPIADLGTVRLPTALRGAVRCRQ